MKQILTIKRGDTRRIPVQLFDESGDPMPMSQVDEVFFTLKRKKSDLDIAALIAKSLADGVEVVDSGTGQVQVVIDPSDTLGITGYARGLHWDIQVVTTTGDVFTMAEGLMAIEADVTQRTA